MSRRHVVAGTMAIAAFCAGCHPTAHQRFSSTANECEQPRVTVRFVNQPGMEVASAVHGQPHAQLVSDNGNHHQGATPCNHNHNAAPCTFSKFSKFGDLFKCATPGSRSTHASTSYDSTTYDNTNYDATTYDNTTQDTVTFDATMQNSTDMAPVKPCNMSGFAGAGSTDAIPQHAVLWGQGYNGCDVTYAPAQLDAGSYTFAYFDPDRGAAFQGWIAVNSGGDDVLSALKEWRDTIHQQEEWLAFEYKIAGKYKSHDPAEINRFNGQLANLRRLEAKLNTAICAEHSDRQQMRQWHTQYLGNAQVVLMPGTWNTLGQPATLPAFQPADLSLVQDGQPMTKVILAGDFSRSMEKIDRLVDLQNEMRRCRTILGEEIVRLENRRSYFRLTSHLYNHDQDFVTNEKRVQQARGMLARIDRQITENRRHSHAVLAVVGLFAPEEANLAFSREQADIRAERAVLAERMRQIEIQYNDANSWSEKRIALEAQRQFLIAQMAECDLQLDQCDQAADTVAQLRQNTGVIYRNGPASVLAASFITDSIPARLANAIEKESMMTVRLHSAAGVRPSRTNLTEGEVIKEQSFIRTNYQPFDYQPGFNQP